MGRYLLLSVLAVGALAVAYVVHLIRRHGAGPVAWRWFSGRNLDGSWHTDATWTRRATKVVHRSGQATPWQHRPRLHRAGIRTGGTTAVIAVLYGFAVARIIVFWCLAAAAAAGLVYGVVLAVLAARTWKHQKTWVRPLHRALRDVAGHNTGIRPREWLDVERDRTRAVIALPAGFAGKAAHKAAVLETVQAKLAIEAPDVRWQLEGPKPLVTVTARPSPPRRVTWDDVARLVAVAPAYKPVIGLGRGGVPAAVDLRESPHILLSVPTGGGKSTLLRILVSGMLSAGNTVAAIADVKWISHPWVKGGLPNVVLCQKIPDIHELLAWLAVEVARRNEVAWAATDVEGRIGADVGPRLVVLVEELNTTMTELRRYWRTVGDGGPSPAVDGLNSALLMGRQVKVHIITAGQQVTAHAAGSGTGREQFGTRILGRYTPAHWKMLAAEVPVMPPSSRHAGRVQVVTGAAAREVQVADITGAQAVDLALSEVTPWPPSLPVALRRLVSQPGTRPLPAERGDVAAATETPPARPLTAGIRLSDAVHFGLVRSSLSVLRKSRYRDPAFPEPVGRDGTAETYSPEALRAWDERRR